MRRALVTGASGFIGRSLMRHLRQCDYHVTPLTRGGTASGTVGVQMLREWDRIALDEALAAARPDVIFHLAGIALGSFDDLYRVNVALAAELLAAAGRMSPAPVVVLAGTAAEYGDVPVDLLPLHEGLRCAPINAYGQTKLLQTELGLAAVEKGQAVVLPRLFNVVGAGMGPHLSLGRFVRVIGRLGPQGGRLETGPLDAERDFIAIDDTVRILETLSRLPEAIGQVVNVCTGHATRLETIVRLLAKEAGCPIEIVIDPSRRGVTSTDRSIGSAERLASFGLSAPLPDFPALVRTMLWSERQRQHAEAEGVLVDVRTATHPA